MAMTLAEAAQACGVNRSTILRALKSGKISGTRDDSGWHVEPVELFRVFEPASAEPKAVPQVAQPDAQTDVMVSMLREQLAELRADRDAWREQAQRLVLGAPKQEPKPQTWWSWLRSSA